MWAYNQTDYLAYHGVLGMKQGVRRYQNYDGSLTAAGRKNIAKSIRKQVDKYSMTQWDELAKNNEAMVEEVRRAVEKDK